jgi:2-keto-4-pentenoate hydratase/2-oxohepta-3-ene-1,7-dioic acid hydratase in catechol pathway
VERALDHVAGYTIANDLSARDVMRRDKNPATSPFHYDWLSQKCFAGSCPLGPWIVPTDDLRDPQNLGLTLWVNDKLMQDSNTSTMIFDTAEQIAMLSSRDACSSSPGDTVKLWIEGIGELIHTMAR